jgi:hypothetical protein
MNKHIEYIFDEIDIRVESLKCELNNLADEIKNELIQIKEKFSIEIFEKCKHTENDCVELQNILEK